MSSTPGKVWRIQLTPRRRQILYAALGLGTALLVVLIFAWVSAYFNSAALERQVAALKDQNAALSQETVFARRQLAALAEKMEAMDIALDEVDKLDRTLRRLANAGPQPSAMGGEVSPIDAARRGNMTAMYQAVDSLKNRALERRLSLSKIQRYFEDRESIILSMPSAWPLKGWVSSGFGMRISPFTGEKAFHEGLDIVSSPGVPVLAPGTGIVAYVGTHDTLGNYLVIKHGQGLTTHYGHLASILVKEGKLVSKGEPIALVGNTGKSTGTHLHYEVRLHGIPVNPERYLPREF